MEEKGELKSELVRTVTNIANNITPDLQLLAKIVRPQSKTATDVPLSSSRSILTSSTSLFWPLLETFFP